jgi:hypothetical protein
MLLAGELKMAVRVHAAACRPFNHCLAPWKMGQEYIWETKKVRMVCSGCGTLLGSHAAALRLD